MGAAWSALSKRDLLEAQPNWRAQLALAAIHTGIWYVAIQYVFPPISKKVISSLKTKDQVLKLNADVFKKVLFYDLGEDPEFILDQVSMFMGVIVQHGFGGLLCVPSVMGWSSRLPPGVAGALARHGALCEVGWEIQDTIGRAHEIFFGGELGLKKNPTPLLVVMGLHHTAAQCLVMPLNVHYPDNVYYHEGVMLLQGAAFSSFMLQQYGFTLNVETPRGLREMRAVITVAAGIMWWSRAIRYSYVWGTLLRSFYRDGDTLMLKLASIPLLGMSLFNVAVLADAAGKWLKFMRMKLGDEGEDGARDQAMEALSAPRLIRHPSSFHITTSRQKWAKVRGAVLMGAIKECSKDD